MILDVMLTTDTDVIEGTAGDDTIEGVASALTSTRTLNPGDQIDGAGGTDTLEVDLTSTFNGFTGDGKMENVEVLDLKNTTELTRNFDTTGATGIETVKVDTNGQTMTVSKLADIAAVEISNHDTSKTVTFGYADKVVDGDDDTINVTLNDVGAAKTDSAAEKQLDLVSADIENLEVVAAGSSNFADLSIGDSESLKITGAADLKVTAVDTTVTEVDGSGATGDLNLNLAGATSNTIKTGTGDDTVTVDALTVDATIEGGAGEDVLVLDNVTAVYQPTMSGFETLRFKDQAGDITIDASGVSDVSALEVMNGTTANTIKYAQSGIAALDINLTNDGETGAVGTVGTLDVTSATELNVSTKYVKDGDNIYETNILGKTAPTVVVNVADKTTFSGGVNADSATSYTATVAKGGTLSNTAIVKSAESVELTYNGTATGATVTAESATSVNLNVGCTAAKIKRPPSDDILSCFFELGVIEMEARNGENLV
jgi:hypothetical protein